MKPIEKKTQKKDRQPITTIPIVMSTMYRYLHQRNHLCSKTRLRNDLYCVEWDVKLYYTIPYYVTGHNKIARIDSRSFDQRFGNDGHRLSVSGLHHLKAAVESQDNSTGLQLPMTASTSFGQRTRELQAGM